MINENVTKPRSEAGDLIGGIMLDVQTLISQQMGLLRHEIGEDVARARRAAYYIVVGLAVFSSSILLLSMMLVYLLAQKMPTLPLWSCFGFVGLPLVFLGIALYLNGLRQFNHEDAALVTSPGQLKEQDNA